MFPIDFGETPIYKLRHSIIDEIAEYFNESEMQELMQHYDEEKQMFSPEGVMLIKFKLGQDIYSYNKARGY